MNATSFSACRPRSLDGALAGIIVRSVFIRVARDEPRPARTQNARTSAVIMHYCKQSEIISTTVHGTCSEHVQIDEHNVKIEIAIIVVDSVMSEYVQ
jgi:hypothetical protein